MHYAGSGAVVAHVVVVIIAVVNLRNLALKFGNKIFSYLDLQKLSQLAKFLRYKGPILDLVLLSCPLKITFSNFGSRENFWVDENRNLNIFINFVFDN